MTHYSPLQSNYNKFLASKNLVYKTHCFLAAFVYFSVSQQTQISTIMKNLLLFFAFILCNIIQAQEHTYYQYKMQEKNINQALDSMHTNCTLSKKKIQKALAIGSLTDFQLYYAAQAYTNCNDFDSAFVFLNAIKPYRNVFCDDYGQYCLLKDIIQSDELLPLHSNIQKWKSWIEKMKNEVKMFEDNAKHLLFFKELDDIDQLIRWLNMKANSKELEKATWSMMAQQDSIAQLKLNKFIDTFGFPSMQMAGEFPFNLMIHDHKNHQKYLKLLEKNASKGATLWENYENILMWTEFPNLKDTLVLNYTFLNPNDPSNLDTTFNFRLERIATFLNTAYPNSTINFLINHHKKNQTTIDKIQQLIIKKMESSGVSTNRIKFSANALSKKENTTIHYFIE